MPGFWEENPEAGSSGTGSYIGEAEKNEMIENGETFPITELAVRPNPFQDGEQYVLKIIRADEDGDDEERILTFNIGSVESRDRDLGLMAAWLEDPANDPVQAKLEKVGRSILVRPADAPAPAKPARKAAAKTATKAPVKRAAAKK